MKANSSPAAQILGFYFPEPGVGIQLKIPFYALRTNLELKCNQILIPTLDAMVWINVEGRNVYNIWLELFWRF